jgi:hypothetical protein
MQTPTFPFDLSRMMITQRWADRGFLSDGQHYAWDIIPLYKRSDGLPADVYPVFDGKAMSIADSSTSVGKGIRVRTPLWPHVVDYLKSFSVIPNDHAGPVWLDILYWHLLDVTDEDGWINQHTPVGICGNTGNVYSHGETVPDSQKGVPPYPGLHLHLECVLGSGTQIFNNTGNSRGRIDPDIIFNYKPPMSTLELVHIEGTQEYGFLETTEYTKIFHRATSLADLQFMGGKFGVAVSDLSSARDIRL